MQSRSRWLIAGAAAVVLAGAVALIGAAVLSSRPGPGDTAASTCALAPFVADSGPVVDPVGVTVAEQGFSVVADAQPRITVGAILRNDTGRTAYRTQVVFGAADASGRPVVSGRNLSFVMVEVPVIPPGGRVAVGNTLVGDESARVDQVFVNPVVSTWLAPGDALDGLAPVTAAVVVGSGTRGDDGSARFRFGATSSNCMSLVSRGAGFVWRDSAGRIVGGDVDTRQSSACQAGGSGGDVAASTAEKRTPIGADLDRTEVSPYCDLQPRSQRPWTPLSPVN